jgi:hypothetical protein
MPVQWSEIPAEELPEVFETHLPVCWSCHIAETFRREYPKRVVDRPWKRGALGEYIADERQQNARISNSELAGKFNKSWALFRPPGALGSGTFRSDKGQ